MRSRAWTCVFSSTHSTRAASGGLTYSPTMSRTFSMNCGSGDSLKVSVRCGFNPKALQILLIADWLIPVASAIERVDQWVASRGVASRVVTMTVSTCSSEIVRGAPGRGSSFKPSRRHSQKRCRHFETVPRSTPSRWATSPMVAPVALSSTIRQRRASACALVGRRDHRSSVARSSSVSTTCTVGLPRRDIAAPYRRR